MEAENEQHMNKKCSRVVLVEGEQSPQQCRQGGTHNNTRLMLD